MTRHLDRPPAYVGERPPSAFAPTTSCPWQEVFLLPRFTHRQPREEPADAPGTRDPEAHALRQVPAVPPARRSPDRTWPDQRIEKAPLWCSVDLRDGNQALIDPMDPARKRRMFDTVVQMGFKEIEVGFPSASQPDFDFVRQLIEEDLVPDDVTIQVLTQCRPELIERTYECLQGANKAIVHFYNSTSVLQRRVVFGLDKDGITQIATDAAKLCRKLEPTLAGTDVRYEYSPESFTGTEVDYAIEICAAVMRRHRARRRPAADPQPAGHRRDVHAEHLRRRHRVLPPQRAATATGSACRCTRTTTGAPASPPPSSAIMAGADRVEGTLFGNGERTGNVDVINIAMNLFSQGVDPELDISDIDAPAPGRRVLQPAARAPAPPLRRRPRLHVVLGQPPGRHQEGLRRARLRRLRGVGRARTCPIDPKHVGRTYEAVIRVNSQSRQGRRRLPDEGGARPRPARAGSRSSSPRRSRRSPRTPAPRSPPAEMWADLRGRRTSTRDAPVQLLSHETTTGEKGSTVTAQLLVDGEHRTVHGAGTGPARRVRRRPPGRPRHRPRGRRLQRARRQRRHRRHRGRLRRDAGAPTARSAGASGSTRASSPRRCGPSSAPSTATAPTSTSSSATSRSGRRVYRVTSGPDRVRRHAAADPCPPRPGRPARRRVRRRRRRARCPTDEQAYADAFAKDLADEDDGFGVSADEGDCIGEAIMRELGSQVVRRRRHRAGGPRRRRVARASSSARAWSRDDAGRRDHRRPGRTASTSSHEFAVPVRRPVRPRCRGPGLLRGRAGGERHPRRVPRGARSSRPTPQAGYDGRCSGSSASCRAAPPAARAREACSSSRSPSVAHAPTAPLDLVQARCVAQALVDDIGRRPPRSS